MIDTAHFHALTFVEMESLAALARAANVKITVRPNEGTPDGEMMILYEYVFEPVGANHD